MSLPFVLHTLFLIISLALTFYWTSQPSLSYYNLQLIGIFIILYFLSSFISRRRPGWKKTTSYLNAGIFSLIIVFLVVSTGNLNSPVFFIFYFLLFGLSFLVEPIVALSLTATHTLFSLFFSQVTSQTAIINLASLWFITPLAGFFGQAYLKQMQQKKLIKILSKSKRQVKHQLIHDETDILMWLTLDLKASLTGIMDQTSNLIAGLVQLAPTQKQALDKIRKSCRHLLRSSEMLKQRVDKLTDK